MTEPTPKEWAQRSLVMKRIALTRSRTFARVAVVIGVVLVAASAVNVFTSGNVVVHILQLVFGLAFLVVAVFRLRYARKELREFEEENGPGAGEQKPVR